MQSGKCSTNFDNFVCWEMKENWVYLIRKQIEQYNGMALNMCNTEINGLGIIICFKKSEVLFERISVCDMSEKLIEHGIHGLRCSYTYGAIDMLP